MIEIILILASVISTITLPVTSSAYIVLPSIFICWIKKMIKMRSEKESRFLYNLAFIRLDAKIAEKQSRFMMKILKLSVLSRVISEFFAFAYVLYFITSLNITPGIQGLFYISVALLNAPTAIRTHETSKRILFGGIYITEAQVKNKDAGLLTTRANHIIEVTINGAATVAECMKKNYDVMNNGDTILVLILNPEKLQK